MWGSWLLRARDHEVASYTMTRSALRGRRSRGRHRWAAADSLNCWTPSTGQGRARSDDGGTRLSRRPSAQGLLRRQGCHDPAAVDSRPARAMPRWLLIWTTLQLTPATALGVSTETRGPGSCRSLHACKRQWTGLRHRPCGREVEEGTCAPGSGLDFDVTSDWVLCTHDDDNDSAAGGAAVGH